MTPADATGIVQGQLILEFNPHVSLDQARDAVAACASASTVIRQQPPMLLVTLKPAQSTKQAAQPCLHVQGVVRAEWNQKRNLRKSQ